MRKQAYGRILVGVVAVAAVASIFYLSAVMGTVSRNHGDSERAAAAQEGVSLGQIPGSIDGDKLYVVLAPDTIRAIDKPEFVPADSASVTEYSPMIVVTIGEETHAYSQWLLNAHEIVNDVLSGKPIAVTW